LDVSPGDYAGQAETAGSGAKHVGIFFTVADYQTVVRAMQSDLADVSAEGSSAVMVLTVNVVGNGSADGDEAGAGRDGKEPSFTEEYADDVGKADAAFAADHASGFVETEDAVESATVNQLSSGVETRVAVAAAEAIGQQRAGRGISENVR
jgi:hypothetical protein